MTEEIKFEKALERLEKIVEELEGGNISLDDALKQYEEGVKLSRACQQKLKQAEKKIEILTRSLDGTLAKEPFDFEESEKENAAATKKKSRAKNEEKSAAGEDGDLLL